MKRRAWRIRDDRSAERELFVPSRDLLGDRGDLTKDELRRLRRAAGSRVVRLYIVWCLFALIMIPFEWYHAITQLIVGHASRELGLAACWTFQFLLFLSAIIYGVYSRPPKFRDAMAEMRRCPSCTYTLAAIEVQLDGCSICPECGTAWKLPKTPPVA